MHSERFIKKSESWREGEGGGEKEIERESDREKEREVVR